MATRKMLKVWEDAADPGVTDDANSGVQNGDYWRNTTSGAVFYAKDNSVGAAVWISADPSTGTVANMDDLGDVALDFDTSAATQDDDGKYVFWDQPTGSFITDPAITHGTVIINSKTSALTASIAKGLPVYIDGFDADLHVVELADADGAAGTYPCVGFTAEPLNDTDSKHVVTFGKLTGINTTNAVTTLNPNGETWSVGTDLYLSKTPGGLTQTRPTGATAIQRIAKVLRVDATGGQIFAYNTLRTAGLPNLAEGKTWVGDANGYPQEANPGNKWHRNFWTYNMVTAAGYTWNGTTVNAPGVGILNSRHRLMAFDDGQGAGTAEGAYVNMMLPLDYVAGTDIKVSANIVTNSTGDAIFYIGVAQPDASNNLGGSVETEWVTQTVAGVAGFRDILTTFTFDGTNMSPGDSLAIMIYRDADAAGDTLTGDCYLHTFEIEEV